MTQLKVSFFFKKKYYFHIYQYLGHLQSGQFRQSEMPDAAGGPQEKSQPASLYRYCVSLTNDVQILLEVKEGDPAGVQTFPCQLQLQFLL